MIVDCELQVTTFEYGAVGRVTKQILPDLREINYGLKNARINRY